MAILQRTTGYIYINFLITSLILLSFVLATSYIFCGIGIWTLNYFIKAEFQQKALICTKALYKLQNQYRSLIHIFPHSSLEIVWHKLPTAILYSKVDWFQQCSCYKRFKTKNSLWPQLTWRSLLDCALIMSKTITLQPCKISIQCTRWLPGYWCTYSG